MDQRYIRLFLGVGTIINGNGRDIQSLDININLKGIIEEVINFPIVVSYFDIFLSMLCSEIQLQNRSVPSEIPIPNSNAVASLK